MPKKSEIGQIGKLIDELDQTVKELDQIVKLIPVPTPRLFVGVKPDVYQEAYKRLLKARARWSDGSSYSRYRDDELLMRELCGSIVREQKQ